MSVIRTLSWEPKPVVYPPSTFLLWIYDLTKYEEFEVEFFTNLHPLIRDYGDRRWISSAINDVAKRRLLTEKVANINNSRWQRIKFKIWSMIPSWLIPRKKAL